MKRKAAERFHGRRGGGYVDDDGPSSGRDVSFIHKLRLSGVAAGTWPEHSLREWRLRAEQGDPRGLEVVAAEKARKAKVK